MELTDLHRLAIALGLGLLVGLQREHAGSPLAGIRTFPLIAVMGALVGLLAETFGTMLPVAALLALGGLAVTGHLGVQHQQSTEPGLTTEIAMLAVFAVGLALAAGHTTLAVLVAGAAAVLLQWKTPLHQLVEKMNEADLRAIMRLVLIAFVILPVLPNRTYGPYEVLNPFEIWLMVVLIVGISLGAYVAARAWGSRSGTLAAGALGGLISSTATTVSYAQRTLQSPGSAGAAALVIMLASTVVLARVLIEIAVVAPRSLAVVAPPLLCFMAFMMLVTAGTFLFTRNRLADPMADEPPAGLTTAVVFGLLYALILFAVAWAKDALGQGGLFIIAGISGLTDVDALTLSTAQLVDAGRLEAALAWRIVLVSVLANLLFKGAVVAVIERRRLLPRLAPAFGLSLAAGVVLLLVWPS